MIPAGQTRPVRALLALAAALCLAAAAFAAGDGVRVVNAQVLMAGAGERTEVVLEVENPGDAWRQVEAVMQLGDVETGLYAFSAPLEVPPASRVQRRFPVVLPLPKEEAPPAATAPPAGPAGESRLPKAQARRSQYPFIVVLKQGAAVLQRETFVAPVLADRGLSLGMDLHPRPATMEERVLPVPARQGYWPAGSKDVPARLALLGRSARLKGVPRSRVAGDVVLPWVRAVQDLQVVEDAPLAPWEEQDILDWTAAGGLLVLDPAPRQARSWWAQLGLEPDEAFLARLPPESRLLANPKPTGERRLCRGAHQARGPQWQELWAEDGTPLGAWRTWGQGRILSLDIPLELLTQQRIEADLAVFQGLFPSEAAAAQAVESRWREHARAWAAKNVGFTVWPRWLVALLLVLFLAPAAWAVFGPPRERPGERRWLAWLGLVAVFTLGVSVALVASSDRGTTCLHLRLLVARAGEGGAAARELGHISMVSGGKRAFPLELPRAWDWSSAGGDASRSFAQGDGVVSWSGFTLLPGRPAVITYAARPLLPAAGEGAVRVGKDRLEARFPAGWTAGPRAVVLGRRVYEAGADGLEASWPLSAGRLLADPAAEEDWTAHLQALARSQDGTIDGAGRAWLARSFRDDGRLAGLPQDVRAERLTVEVAQVAAAWDRGGVALPEGLAAYAFQKGGGGAAQETRASRAFDGLLFRRQAEGASLTVLLRPPVAGLVPRETRLFCDLDAPAGAVELQVEVAGRLKPVDPPGPEGLLLPEGAWNGGRVKVQLSSARGEGMLAARDWGLRRLDVAVKGEIR